MELICFTSPKGSCGASFCTAGIARILTSGGNKCLVADLCHKSSTIGSYLGCDDFVYNLTDVVDERCDFKDAVIEDVEFSGLDFVSSSTLIEPDSKLLGEIISVIRENASAYDYVLCDVPFVALESDAVKQNDTVIFVTDSHRANITALERYVSTVEIEAKTYLIINKVIPELIAEGIAMNIDDICDFLCIPPIGIVPMEEEINIYINSDVLSVTNSKLLSTKALRNIAERIKGKRVLALDFDYKTQYYKIIKNISNGR